MAIGDENERNAAGRTTRIISNLTIWALIFKLLI